MKKSELREYIRNYINEVRLRSGDKTGSLKVYKIGSKYILYMLQKNGEIYFTVGYDLSGNVIRFDEEDGNNNIKKILTANNIKYKEGSRGFGYYIDVDMNDINVIEKPADTTIYQVNPKEDGWYHDLSINEVRLKSVGKGGVLNVFRVKPDDNTSYPCTIYGLIHGVYMEITATAIPQDRYIGMFFSRATNMIAVNEILDNNNIPYEKDVTIGSFFKVNIPSDHVNFIDVSSLNNISKELIVRYSNETGVNETRFRSHKGTDIRIKDIDFEDDNSVYSVFTEPASDDDIEEFENAWNAPPIWGSDDGYIQIVRLPSGEFLLADTYADYYAKTPEGVNIINN